MEINFDEDLLLSQRVNPSYDEPVLHQVLRIAVYDEYHAYEAYRKIIDTFGVGRPFTNIMEAEVRHYSMLIPLLEKYGVPVPIDNWYAKLELPSTILECCEVGVAAEIENIRMYDDLLQYVGDYPDVQDVLYKVQAASYNNHLPAFRKCVAKYSNEPISTQEIMDEFGNPLTDNNIGDNKMNQKINEFSEIAQKLATGQMKQEDVMKLLGNTNMSFMGGILAGGLGATILPKLYSKKEN
jgi:rubrerythrin